MKIFFVGLFLALCCPKSFGNPIFIEVYRCDESTYSRCLLKDLLIEDPGHFMPKSKNPNTITTVTLSSSTVSTLTSDICDAFPNLEILGLNDISLKFIQKGALSSCKKLTNIDLKNNLLSELDVELFRENKLLSQINLNNNKLKSIPETLFNGLSKLLALDLNGNEISRLPSNIFNGLQQMGTLHVGYNPLLSLEIEQFLKQMPMLKDLFFLDVDLSCDRMKEVKDFCEANSININSGESSHLRIRSYTVSSMLYKTINDPYYERDTYHEEREIFWKCLSNEQHEREILLRETLSKMLGTTNFEKQELEMQQKFNELNDQYKKKIEEMKNKTEEFESTYLKKIFEAQTFMFTLMKEINENVEKIDARVQHLEADKNL